MKYVVVLALIFCSPKILAEDVNLKDFQLSDKSYSYSLKLNQKTGKIKLKMIRGQGGLPNSPALVINFADKDSTPIQLRLVSTYENDKPLLEGNLSPLHQSVVGIEFSFLAEDGKSHSLKWRLKQAESYGNKQ